MKETECVCVMLLEQAGRGSEQEGANARYLACFSDGVSCGKIQLTYSQIEVHILAFPAYERQGCRGYQVKEKRDNRGETLGMNLRRRFIVKEETETVRYSLMKHMKVFSAYEG